MGKKMISLEQQEYIRSTVGIKTEKEVARELDCSLWQVRRYRRTPRIPTKMICYECYEELKAIKTKGIKRIRKCKGCGRLVKTIEIIDNES